MKNRNTLLSDINERLDILAGKTTSDDPVISSNALITAAGICCKLLASLYGYSFEDTDTLPDMDFSDSEYGVAVQVRSKRTKQEIQDTVERFQAQNFHSTYKTLIILITQQQPIPGIRDGFSKTEVNLQIMFLSDLNQAITYLPPAELEKISDYLNQELPVHTQTSPAQRPDFPTPTDISESTPSLRQVLFFASLLPGEGLDERLFRHGLKQQSQLKTLDLLLDNHWLLLDRSLLFLNPHIPKEKLKIAEATTRELEAFLDRLWNFEQSWRWYRVDPKEYVDIYRRLAQLFSTAAKLPCSVSTSSRRSAELWMSAGHHDKALTCLKKSLNNLKHSDQDNPWERAYLHHLIAFCNERRNNPKEALKHREETLNLCVQIPVPAPDLAVAYHYVGLAHRTLNTPKNKNAAKEQFNCEISLLENLRTNGDTVFPHSGLAKAYHELSEVYRDLEEPAKQAFYYHKALSAKQEDSGLSDTLLSTLFLSPKHLLPRMSSPSISFIPNSRDTELAALETLLKADSPVFIHGIGGTGKTEVAVQLAYRMAPRKGSYSLKYYNVPTEHDSLRATILRAKFTNYSFRGEETEDREPEYQERMNILRSEYPETLLFIDDFNPPNITLDDLQKERTYRELSSMGIRLVFISRNRIDTKNSIEITPLSEKSLLQLMWHVLGSRSISNETLLKLIRAVNHHTLIVSLIAKALAHTEGLTPEKILKALHDRNLFSHTKNDSASAETDDIIHHSIYACLKILLDLSEMTVTDRIVLGYAALLPKEGMHGTLFRSCLTKVQNSSVNKLTKYGYLLSEKKSSILTIPPIIRQTCLMDAKASDDIYKVFFAKLWSKFSSSQALNVTQLRQIANCFSIASDNLADAPPDLAMMAAICWKIIGIPHRALHYFRRAEALWGENDDPDGTARAKIHQNLSDIHRELGQLSISLEYLEQALTVYEHTHLPSNTPLIKTYLSAVDIHRRLGNYQKALRYARNNLKICSTGSDNNSLSLATAHYTVGNILIMMNRFKPAIKELKKAIDIGETLPASLAPHLAIFYSSIANAYTGQKEYKTALDYRTKALEIQIEILPKNHLDLAISYHNIGVNYSSLDDHYKALEYKLKAMAIREKELPSNHPSLASIYYTVGDTYHALGDLNRALEYRTKSLSIREKALPEKHPDLTATYSIVGYTYLELGQYDSALQNLKKVLAVLQNVPSRDHMLYAVTNTRLGTIYSEKGDYETALTCFRNALDAFKKVYPEAVNTEIVTAYSNMGYTFLMLGKEHEAKKYLQTALEAADTVYPPKHPAIQELHNVIARTHTE